jgi:uncharacterized membrane protein YkvA (DUF1232 family)
MRMGTPRGVDLKKLRANAARVQREFWPKFRRVARRLPFAEELLAAYFCAVDRRTPLHVKAVLMGALAYFVMPTDLIPDFVAGLGYTDDPDSPQPPPGEPIDPLA